MWTEPDVMQAAEDLKVALAAYNAELRNPEDDGYGWLEEDGVCVLVPNPYMGEDLQIAFSYMDITLFFADFHCHYFWENGIREVYQDVLGILNGDICSAVLLYGEKNKALSSKLISASEIMAPVEETFHFVLKEPEFAERLKSNGGKAEYVFWEPAKNKEIRV